jgi:hypothetical protein
VADVVDHYVHVGTGEAADELGQRQWYEHFPQRWALRLSPGDVRHDDLSSPLDV